MGKEQYYPARLLYFDDLVVKLYIKRRAKGGRCCGKSLQSEDIITKSS